LCFQADVLRGDDSAPMEVPQQVRRPAADVEDAAAAQRACARDGLEADDLIAAADPQQGRGAAYLAPMRA